MGIVYVLTNPALEGYVKIGKTGDLEKRLRDLDNTSVPLPFRCVYAVEIEDEAAVEIQVHQVFEDHRTRNKREFFEIDPRRAIAALRLTGGRDVTPKGDIAEDEEGVDALAKAATRRRPRKLISDAGLRPGNILYYAYDVIKGKDPTVEVISEKKVSFEGQETSLSAAALTVLHRDGYKWPTVSGWQYWMFDGETIAERADRLANSED